MKTMSKILIIASHPDDECLGCGSTMHKYTNEGHEVYCLILGEGAIMHGLTRQQLEAQSRQAGKIIGFKQMYFYDCPDNRFDTIPLLDICKTIEAYLDKIKPDIVYTHFKGDMNIDHRLTFQAVATACRPGCSTVKEIYSFEIPSSTEWGEETFKPNVFVDVSKTLSDKLAAFGFYTTEIRDFPHPRSTKGLVIRAQYWGQVAGVEYAEAFELVRSIK